MPTFDQIRQLYPDRARDSDEAILQWVADTTKLPLAQVADSFGYGSDAGKTGQRFSSAIDSYQANMYGLGEAVAGATGLRGAEDWMRRGRQTNETAADVATSRARGLGAVDAWKDVHGVGDFGDYVAGLAIQSAPYMAEAVVGGGVGGFAARGLATAGARAAARTAGAVGASYPSAVGDVLSNQREQAGRTDLGAAAAYGVPYALANAFGVEGALARGQLFRNVVPALDRVGGVRGGVTRAGVTAGRTVLTEGASETFQEGMNQFGRMAVDPSETFYNPRSAERFGESFAGGASLGGVFGGAGGGWRRSRQPPVDSGQPVDLTQRQPLELSSYAPDEGPAYGLRPEGQQPRRAPIPGQYDLFNPDGSPTYGADPSFGDTNPLRPMEPQFTTAPGASPGYSGVPFVREIDTSGLSLLDQGESRLPARGTPAKRPFSPLDFEAQMDAPPPSGPLILPPGLLSPAQAQPIVLTPQEAQTVWSIARDKADQGLPLTATEQFVLDSRDTGGRRPGLILPQERGGFRLDGGSTPQFDRPQAQPRPDFELQAQEANPAQGALDLQPRPEAAGPASPQILPGNRRGAQGQLPFSGNARSPQGQLFQGRIDSLAAEGYIDESTKTQADTLIAQGKFGKLASIVKEAEKNKAAALELAERMREERMKAAADDWRTREADELLQQIEALAKERGALVTKAGSRPPIGSKKRDRWNQLTDQIREATARREELTKKGPSNASAAGGAGPSAAAAGGREPVQREGGQRDAAVQQQPEPAAAAPAPAAAGGEAAPAVPAAGQQPGSLEGVTSEALVQLADDADFDTPQKDYEDALDELYRRWRDDGDEVAAAFFEENLRHPGFAQGDFVRTRERAGETAQVPQKPQLKKLGSEGKRGLKLGRVETGALDEGAKETDTVLRGLATPKFMRARGAAASPARIARIRAYVTGIVSRWANQPDVFVLPSIDDPRVPAAVREENASQKKGGAELQTPVAVYHQGSIFIFADAITDARDLTEALFHEGLGHYGIRGVFGRAIFQALDALARARPDLMRAKAKQYGFDLTKESDRLQAADEVLAELAQTRPSLTWVQQAVAAVRTWLRENVPLFRNLQVSDSEIIRDYIVPARDWVERGRAGDAAQRVVNETTVQEDRPAGESALARWFGDSKVVDDQGQPLVVYHGTMRDFNVFEDGKSWHSGVGHYFTPDPKYAAQYTNRAEDGGSELQPGGNVMPVYLKIERPYVISPKNRGSSMHFTPEQRDALIAQGYDGVINERAKEYVVFRPEQIKSALGNQGSYDPTNPDIRFMRAANTEADTRIAKSFANVPYAKTKLGQMVQDALFNLRESPWALKWVTNDQIAEGYSHLKPVQDINRATMRMASVANRYLEGASQIAKKWRALADETQLAMQRVMLQSTMDEMHVSIKGETGYLSAGDAWKHASNSHIEKTPENRAKFDKLYQSFMALPAPAKTVYDQVRDHLAQQHKDTLKALRQSVASHYATQLRRQLTTEELNALADSDAGAKAAFQDFMQVAGTRTELRALEGLYQALRDLNKDFGTVRGPYFPLVRFGEHVVVMKSKDLVDLELEAQGLRAQLQQVIDDAPAQADENEEAHQAKLNEIRGRYNKALKAVEAAKQDERKYVVEFHETPAQAERARAALTEKNPNADVYRSVREQYYRALDGASPAFLKDLQETLGAALDAGGEMSPEARETALNAVKDMYLRRQPERSALRSELKRMSIEGVQSAQMLRGFAQSARNGAWRVSRLLHAGEVTAGLGALSEDRRSPDAKHVLNELKARFVGDIAPPEDNAWLRRAQATTYFMHLGFNLSYFITNATQAWTTSLPVMAGRHGIVNSANSLMAASQDVVKLLAKATASSVEENGAVVGLQLRLTDEQIASLAKDDGETQMLKALTRDGVIDITIKHDLGAISDGTTKSIPGKVMELSSALANYPELYNRLATALAAYRMESSRREGADESAEQVQERAREYAERIINRTHFNYSPENAPRMMRGQLGRLVFQFKRYQQGMIYLFARLIKQASGGDKDAQRALAYLLGMTTAVGGVVALPIAAPIALAAKVLAAAYPDDDEPEWLQQWYNGMKDGVGEPVAQALVKGLPAGVGVDLSTKLGQGNLLNPVAFANTGGKDTLSSDWWTAVTASLMGPAAMLVGKELEAAGQLLAGKYTRAAELSMPTFIANGVKAFRRAAEGEQTRSGDQLLEPEEFGALATATKALGFETTKVSDAYDQRSAYMRMLTGRQDARKALLREYYEAVKSGDSDAMQAAQQAIAGFNERQPADRVRSGDLAASLKQRDARRREMRGGLRVGRRDEDTYRNLTGGE